MKKNGYTFSGSRLIYLDGGATQTLGEQPQPAPETAPLQPETLKAPEKTPTSADVPTQENAKIKAAATKKFDAARTQLDTIANVVV
jgi:hypothetical protein